MKDILEHEKEEIAKEWIKNNPHVAICYVVSAHSNNWFGCGCPIAEVTPEVRRYYAATLERINKAITEDKNQ